MIKKDVLSGDFVKNIGILANFIGQGLWDGIHREERIFALFS